MPELSLSHWMNPVSPHPALSLKSQERVRLLYIIKALNLSERFVYREHAGGHEFDQGDEGIDFLCKYLKI